MEWLHKDQIDAGPHEYAFPITLEVGFGIWNLISVLLRFSRTVSGL